MTIQTIQLNKLALSDLNVRKVKPKEIEALAADIQARGVLQNLIGYDEDGKIKICAGGRRYRALKLLQKAKTIPGTFEVPVEIRSKDEALEISLAENAQREDMLGHVSRVSFDRKDYRAVCLFQAARSAYPKSWRRAAWNKHLRGGCGILRCGISVASPSRGRLVDLLARLSAQHI